MKHLLIILMLCLNSWAGEILIEDSKGCVQQPKNTPPSDPTLCVKDFFCCRTDKKLYPKVDDRQMSCTGDFGDEQLLSAQFSLPCAKYPATYDPHDDCPESVLTVSVEGPGKVASTSAGISCGEDCTEEYPSGVEVELTAAPDAGAEFVSWSGACAGTGPVCHVKMDKNQNAHAVFKTNVLTVTLAGDGQGSVSGTGISCGEDCEEHYTTGASVSLSATAISTADYESVFVNWSGACSGSGNCVVTMIGDKTVTANFKRTYQYKLNVVKSGVGTGTVTGGEINCGGTCEKIYAAGAMVSLTARADTGSTFRGWSGPCTGTGTCSITMDAAKTVVADFEKPVIKSLTVTIAGAGKGKVTGPKIDCSPDCRESYLPSPAPNETVVLTAQVDATSSFVGWTGACTGTSPTCSITMTASKTVTATFNTSQLTVSKAGDGTGTVTSSPTGINCGAACVQKFPPRTSVTLTQQADAGSIFKFWSGACTGAGSCGVLTPASGNQSVIATFIKASSLVVTKSGAGSGTVTSPAGINCGSECQKEILAGTRVALTATPDANSFFKEWQGRCSGTNTTCSNLVINGVTAVNAVFDSNVLTVTKTGNGTVTDAGGVINCGAACSGKYGRNVPVTLSAAPAAGSTFIGWSGACSGLGGCAVTMTASKTVNAAFSDSGLVVSKEGTGNGTVVSAPPGISCGSTCAAAFPKDSVVGLTASPNGLAKFEGWRGVDCASAGTGACSLTMNTVKNASANFSEICNHDGRCQSARSENCMNCNDCACPNMNTCEPSGASYRCERSCGNGSCDSNVGENCSNCRTDCGACETTSVDTTSVDGCNAFNQGCSYRGRSCCSGNCCGNGKCGRLDGSCGETTSDTTAASTSRTTAASTSRTTAAGTTTNISSRFTTMRP